MRQSHVEGRLLLCEFRGSRGFRGFRGFRGLGVLGFVGLGFIGFRVYGEGL